MKPLILIGGGGHCISCIDVIERTGQYKILGILDLPEKNGQWVLNYRVVGTDNDIDNFLSSCNDYLITLGQIKTSSTRERLFDLVKAKGGNLPVIKSPLAYVSVNSEIREGSILMHHALINSGAKVGICCIINSKALIEHEASVGDFCHVSTASVINGQAEIGNSCFVGSNSVVGNNIKIVSNVIISAGSKILKNIAIPGTYIGSPLRKVR
jgi:sugar O-acyltransferase (sialic acid O-acetyltransferase NeuD family)